MPNLRRAAQARAEALGAELAVLRPAAAAAARTRAACETSMRRAAAAAEERDRAVRELMAVRAAAGQLLRENQVRRRTERGLGTPRPAHPGLLTGWLHTQRQ